MATLELTLGALVLGVYLNTFLYGLVTFQYLTYFSKSSGDPLWIKSIVSGLFALDSSHSASLIYMAWYYTVAHYGQPEYLLFPVWPYPFSVFVTAFTAFITQSFLCYRIIRLTKNRYLYVTIMILALGAFGLGIVLSVKTWTLGSLVHLSKLNPHLASWLAMQVAVDAIICGVLIIALSRSKTGFENSDNVINRLTRTSIQTGVFSGTCSILCLVLFITRPGTQLFGIFGIPISRLYTNTLMDTLICRENLREMFNKRDTFTANSVRLDVRPQLETDIKFDASRLGSNSMMSTQPYSPKYSTQTGDISTTVKDSLEEGH